MLTRRWTGAVAAALVAGSLLAGCSGDDGDDGQGGGATSSGSSAGSPSAGEPYLPVPAGVELTKPGTELEVGDAATVAWEPDQETVGVVEVTVTRLEQTTFARSFSGWKVGDALEGSAPYFVRATVRNVGESDLSGQRVPLYIVDGTNTLVEYSQFSSTYRPCPSEGFPARFRPGASADLCLVYLAPNEGDLTAVSFRPTQEFNPITWTGKLQQVRKRTRR